MPSLADRWHSAILKNSLDLMRFDAHQRTEILALINELGRGLVADLSGAGLDTPRTDWQRARLRELLKAAQDRISGTYEDIATTHAEGLAGAVEASTTGLTVAMNEAAGVELLQAIKWTPEQLASLVDGSLVEGAPSAAWWARQSVDLQNAFEDQMRMGMARGESITQLRDRIMGQNIRGVNAVGKVDLRTIAPENRGLIQVARRNAETLVRTSAMSANNSAHLAMFDLNSDIIAGIEWTATFDRRVCTRCLVLDQLRWDLNHNPIGHDRAFPGPVLHWGDRCSQVPWTKSWEELATKNKDLARKLDQMEPGMRASMGGPVSADTTWESWLKGQGPKVQEEILGPARLNLWKAGKLSLSDLVDQRGNALTLDELRAR